MTGLVAYASAERVLEQMLKVLPETDLFSIADTLSEDRRLIGITQTETPVYP